VTPLGVVFLFTLENWWVEKHQRFLFNVYKRFFYFGHVFYVFLFYFFLERFLHLCITARNSSTNRNIYAFHQCQKYNVISCIRLLCTGSL